MSVKRYILLDGYNIIYASDALKHLMPNNKLRARESLAEMVQAIHSVEDVHIIIIFDSSNNAVEVEYPFRDKTFEFVFAPKSLTADGVIERILVRIKNKEQVSVVSNDNLVREATRSNGAAALRPKDLFDWIRSSNKRLNEMRNINSSPKDKTLENRINIDLDS
ncbi:MAG: NYN domain-containing protein [Opitutae bacterium]|nr:NYN domain-containing protein [Opitutae bacterium]